MKGKGGRGERRRTSQIIRLHNILWFTGYRYKVHRYREDSPVQLSIQRYKTYNMNTYLRLISALAISDSEGSPLKVGGLVQWWGG